MSPAAASPDWKLCSRSTRWRATEWQLTLVSPTPDFVYRPLAVAEPFALGRRRRTALAHATRATGAAFVQAPLVCVDVAAKTVQVGDGREACL